MLALSAKSQHEIRLYVSDRPLPPFDFLGLAFDGSDVIAGLEGYGRFRQVRKKTLKPGADGAYIVLERRGDLTEIGADYGGYLHLFLYQHENFWALSNSFLELASYVSRRGVPLTPNLSHLSGFFVPRAMWQQPTTLRTGIREIRLVPPKSKIVIKHCETGNRLVLENRTENEIKPGYSYRDALGDYVRCWVGRMATMLQSDAFLICDVTGGRDSRTVLALMLSACRLLGIDPSERISFNSNPRNKNDLDFAKQLGDSCGFSIGLDIARIKRSSALHATEAYEIWKTQYLGAYHPIYFNDRQRNGLKLWSGGSGGETVRPIKGIGVANEVIKLLDSARGLFWQEAHFEELRADFVEDLETLRTGERSDISSVLLHFRSFRERFHHGRRAMTNNAISPLSGQLLRQVGSLADKKVWNEGTVLADVMANAYPDVFGIPFEKDYTGFHHSDLADRTQLPNILKNVDLDGRCFLDMGDQSQSRTFQRKEVLDILAKDFEQSISRMQSLDLVPTRSFEMFSDHMKLALSEGGFRHPKDGCGIATVVLSAALADMWTS
jgi:hypothetical protein